MAESDDTPPPNSVRCDMERDKKLAWFLAADDRAKAAVLASIIHLMTLEVRGV